MLYRRIFFIILPVLLLNIISNAQSKKEILGTFEIGCKVFNYNFTKNTNGIYSFRIEYAETETLLYVANKDTLKNTKSKLLAAIKTLSDTIGQNTLEENLVQNKQDSLRRDSFLLVKTGFENFIEDISNENNTVNNIYLKRDQLRSIIKIAKKLNLNTAWSDTEDSYPSDSLYTKIEKAISNSITIAETRTYPMNVFEQEPFQIIVKNLLTKRESTFLKECTTPGVDMIAKKATALFFEIKARLDFQDDEPSTAYLKLKSNFVKCYFDNHRKIQYHASKDKNNNQILNKFFVNNVTVEFEDGTIKNIFADLNLTDQSGNPIPENIIRFKNISPISISTKTDPDAFEKIKIFAGEEKHLSKKYNLVKSNSKAENTDPPAYLLEVKNKEAIKEETDNSILEEEVLYFYLSELLDYSIIAENDREDYSPANTVVTLNKQSSSVELKKEKRSKILTVRAFTDFIGIQNEEPNGLIQIEASKKMNFNTAKYGGAFAYSGFFSYVEPILTFSKIEKNKNSLELTASDLDQTQLQNGKKSFILRPINLYKFQKSSFDVNLNLWKFNLPELKSNLQVNASIGILKTNTVDTIAVTGANTIGKTPDPNFTVLNTLKWGFTAIWEIKLESRYGVNFGWDRRKFNVLNEGFTIPSNETSNIKLLNTAWVDAFLKTNDDSKLFFRYRFTFEDKATKRNFVQIQLGYLMDLFKTKK